jgi:signal transduction histidine kinase
MPVVMGDETALYQVFVNLLGNALKFSQPDTPLVIKITFAEQPREYVISVQDNGLGIPPDRHEDIFQAFYRLRETEQPGSGIGLAIVRRIILRHGGSVWVESEPGHGATFSFTLPRRGTDHLFARKLDGQTA